MAGNPVVRRLPRVARAPTRPHGAAATRLLLLPSTASEHGSYQTVARTSRGAGGPLLSDPASSTDPDDAALRNADCGPRSMRRLPSVGATGMAGAVLGSGVVMLGAGSWCHRRDRAQLLQNA